MDLPASYSGRLTVDPTTNELFLSSGGSIQVFSSTGSGSVTPVRTLNLPKWPGISASGLAICN